MKFREAVRLELLAINAKRIEAIVNRGYDVPDNDKARRLEAERQLIYKCERRAA